jgi:hypothetical protein
MLSINSCAFVCACLWRYFASSHTRVTGQRWNISSNLDQYYTSICRLSKLRYVLHRLLFTGMGLKQLVMRVGVDRVREEGEVPTKSSSVRHSAMQMDHTELISILLAVAVSPLTHHSTSLPLYSLHLQSLSEAKVISCTPIFSS